jgi:hypothetical protein
MKNSDKKFNANDYTPRRFGLKYSPPQIVLEYVVPSRGKLYHHKIKLPKLKDDSQLTDVMKEIYEKHFIYLDNKKINPNQILKLVEKLKSNIKPQQISSVSKENDNISPNKSSGDIKKINDKTKPVEQLTKSVEINELEDDNDEDDYYKFDYDYENEDLNKLNSEELKKKKQQMEKLYEKNAITPNDDNFVFDVRVS